MESNLVICQERRIHELSEMRETDWRVCYGRIEGCFACFKGPVSALRRLHARGI